MKNLGQLLGIDEAKQQSRLDKLNAKVQNNEDRKNFDVTVTDGVIAHKGKKYTAPATARVESAGEARVTATRLVALGIFAFAFKKGGELYLTVEGDGWAFAVPFKAKLQGDARNLAARINSL